MNNKLKGCLSLVLYSSVVIVLVNGHRQSRDIKTGSDPTVMGRRLVLLKRFGDKFLDIIRFDLI